MNQKRVRVIAGTAILTALIVVFQIIGNYVQFGPVSINLSLLPIALGAILYGPLVGFMLGVINGALILLAPSTGIFLSYSIFWTVLVCILKTGLAGLLSGLIFKLFKGKGIIPGIFISSLIIPIINSGIFILACLTVMRDIFIEAFNKSGMVNMFIFMISVVITWNFLFEFLTTLLLTPTLIYVVKVVTKNYDIGDNLKDILIKRETVKS